MTKEIARPEVLDYLNDKIIELQSQMHEKGHIDKYIVSQVREIFDLHNIVEFSVVNESQYKDGEGDGEEDQYAIIFDKLKLSNGVVFDSDSEYKLPDGMSEDEALESISSSSFFEGETDLSSVADTIASELFETLFLFEGIDFYGTVVKKKTYEYEGETIPEIDEEEALKMLVSYELE